MSETTKRGSPTEDGWYICLYRGRFAEPAFDIATYQKNGVLYWADGTRVSCVEVILAHRRHEPLVVPELRELHRCEEGRACVVRVTGSGDRQMDGVYYAVKRVDGYIVHTAWQTVPQFNWSTTTELTKEQCEAEGYKWPL